MIVDVADVLRKLESIKTTFDAEAGDEEREGYDLLADIVDRVIMGLNHPGGFGPPISKPWHESDVVRDLLKVMIDWHTDPNSAGYNDCDKDICMWCDTAKRVLKEQRENRPPGAEAMKGE